ncbi:MAG TPA: DUF4157 domain-containing protein [Polyangia bacterium]|nr:DUF4157 domain-containing protein [Polyangia bacterium]
MRDRQERGSAQPEGEASVESAPGSSLRELAQRRRAIQRKAAGTPESQRAAATPKAAGSGQPLPAPVQQKMERSFGADFSTVRVHQGPQAEAMGAEAYTEGEQIHFRAGRYDPASASGQEVLGHELSHVVQQRAGRVAVPQGKGAPVNADAALESEADAQGARAARGEPAGAAAGAAAASSTETRPIQRLIMKMGNPISGDLDKIGQKVQPDNPLTFQGGVGSYDIRAQHETDQEVAALQKDHAEQAVDWWTGGSKQLTDENFIVGHSQGMAVGGVVPVDLAKGLVARGIKPGMSVRLVACSTAKNADEGLAKTLLEILKTQHNISNITIKGCAGLVTKTPEASGVFRDYPAEVTADANRADDEIDCKFIERIFEALIGGLKQIAAPEMYGAYATMLDKLSDTPLYTGLLTTQKFAELLKPGKDGAKRLAKNTGAGTDAKAIEDALTQLRDLTKDWKNNLQKLVNLLPQAKGLPPAVMSAIQDAYAAQVDSAKKAEDARAKGVHEKGKSLLVKPGNIKYTSPPPTENKDEHVT